MTIIMAIGRGRVDPTNCGSLLYENQEPENPKDLTKIKQ